MTAGTVTAESWLYQLLHPDKIPPEALAGGMTPELAWERWCAEKRGEKLPTVARHSL